MDRRKEGRTQKEERKDRMREENGVRKESVLLMEAGVKGRR